MIAAEIFKDKNGVILGFSLKGHAGYSKKGSDIVCSAVSILVINTINCIEELTKEKLLVEEDEDSGCIYCQLPDRKDGSADKEADLLIRAMIFGLKALEEQYAKHLKIREVQSND